jgi:hypothetical protein
LENLKASAGTRIGVFATGGVKPKNSDSAYMRTFVTSLPAENIVNVKSVIKLVKSDGKSPVPDVDTLCREFVAELV